MIYHWSLHTVGWIVGLLLIAGHLVALLNARQLPPLLRAFPRSLWAGRTLLTIDALWAIWLVTTMDLSEFTPWRPVIQIAIVAGYFLTLFFVDELLAVRALGILLILAAEPLLEAAFLQPYASRNLLSLLAYAWAILGLFWIGKPYLLRDQIAWVCHQPSRLTLAALGGLAYGIAVLACALLVWK
jgi:hypothetical protein